MSQLCSWARRCLPESPPLSAETLATPPADTLTTPATDAPTTPPAAARFSETPARDSRFSMAFRVSGYDGEVAEKTELHSMMARFKALRTSQRLSGFWSPFASPSIAGPPEDESDFRSPVEEEEAVAEDAGHSYRSDTSSHVISPSHEPERRTSIAKWLVRSDA